MPEDNFYPSAHFAVSYLETSEADISKAFDPNDTKFSRAVKMLFSMTFHKVWTCGS